MIFFDFPNFGTFPLLKGLIQGPIFVSGGESPNVPSLGNPLMLPIEINPPEFIIPPNADFSLLAEGLANTLVYEENQVDRVIFNNLDVRGNLPSVGTLSTKLFEGMTMAQDTYVLNAGPFSGVGFEGIEVMTFNLGDGVDSITVESTSEAIHEMNLGGENDEITIKSLSGPLLINGDSGNDTVHVSSNEKQLRLINALLAFDGGDDSFGDVLTLDNSEDYDLDNVLNVTRLMIEVESMALAESVPTENNPILPRDSYIINLRNSTGGSFVLSMDDPLTNRIDLEVNVTYGVAAETIAEELTTALLGNIYAQTCGQNSSSFCADPVKVLQLGNSDTYAIFFVGERLNAGVTLSLLTEGLSDFYSEIFVNRTNDILAKTSDTVYTNVDFLNIHMGHQNIVSNIRGTSAETHIFTQEGDDHFFVSSDANESNETLVSAEVLYGVLDYMERDLHIHCDSGRHRLFMSDAFSWIGKGGPSNEAILTNSSLLNLADNLGNIYFAAGALGNWFEGIDLWLGRADDYLNVTSIQALAPGQTFTSVHAGNGSDVLSISLEYSEYSLFVGNGQGGDDKLDASDSSLPVILFGDGGNDIMYGGTSEDVLIGDYGRVFWIDDMENEVARVGGGGYDDYSDGVVRQIHRIEASNPPSEINYYDDPVLSSGSDNITGNGARDVIIGGGGEKDIMSGNEGSDIILGSFGVLLFDDSSEGALYGLRSLESFNCSDSSGEENVIYGNEGDGKFVTFTLGWCVARLVVLTLLLRFHQSRHTNRRWGQ